MILCPSEGMGLYCNSLGCACSYAEHGRWNCHRMTACGHAAANCRRDEQALSPLAFPAFDSSGVCSGCPSAAGMGEVTAFKMKGLSKLTEIILSKRFLARFFDETAAGRWLLKSAAKKSTPGSEKFYFSIASPKRCRVPASRVPTIEMAGVYLGYKGNYFILVKTLQIWGLLPNLLNWTLLRFFM